MLVYVGYSTFDIIKPCMRWVSLNLAWVHINTERKVGIRRALRMRADCKTYQCIQAIVENA